MKSELLTASAAEPVTLAEAKAHMRVEHTADDDAIPGIITAAREWLEQVTGLALITQTWRAVLNRWPVTAVELRPAPVQSIASVKVFASDGSSTTLSASTYDLLSVGRTARLVRGFGATWPNPTRPQGGVEVTFVAGYGDAASDVPAALRQVLLMCVAHLYENRELLGEGLELPVGLNALLAPYMEQRL